MNLTTVPIEKTANTALSCAQQRAETLSNFNIKTVLELCVGPSLNVLEKTYNRYNIDVTGNDIDIKWKHYYPYGKWIIADALSIDYTGFDAVIFAPPLTKGCTGKREDALSVFDVKPKYTDFLDKIVNYDCLSILVLPGKTFSIKKDREQYYKLYNYIYSKNLDIKLVQELKNKVTKYVEIYVSTKKD